MGRWKIKNSQDSYDLESAFGVTITDPIGVSYPPQEIITSEYGQDDGELVQRILVKPRIFKLVGTLVGSNDIDLLLKRLFLTNALSRDEVVTVTADGEETITPIIVQFSLAGKTIEINALMQSGLEGSRSGQDMHTEKLTLEFRASDPFWYDPEGVTIDLALNTTNAVDNAGTTATYPQLILAGEGIIESLANDTIGQTITFTGLSILPGETVTLDLRPGRKTLTSDVRGNLLFTIDRTSKLTSWQLRKNNNDIVLTASSGQVALGVGDGSALGVADVTLNLTQKDLVFNKRHWGVEGVVA